jgi:hypothetical protein
MGICPPSLAAEGGPVFIEYLNIVQAVIPNALTTLATINAGETGMRLMIVVCSFVNVPVGYDLKVRPGAVATANKHFWRGSGSGGVGQLRAGNTEIWRLHIRPGSEWIIEANKQSGGFGDISITVSCAEMEDPT